MRSIFLVFFALVICPVLAAQQAMNNDSVIKMVKAGLSDDIIIASVNSQSGNFDTTTDGLVALKAGGASDKVVAAIIARHNAPAVAGAETVSASAPDPNDPGTRHDPGLYLMTTARDGKPLMVFIDRAGAASVHTANVVGYAFSYGIAKAKIKAEIPNPHAPIRAGDPRPIFYMYFPSADVIGGLGGNGVITSPSQFSLLHLEEKKDHRETEIAKMGFASAHAGVDDKKEVLFTSDRIRNGVYKITPNVTLGGGEYAFVAATGSAGTAAGGQTVVIYDFGVDR